jgi:chromosome segregation ATPase
MVSHNCFECGCFSAELAKIMAEKESTELSLDSFAHTVDKVWCALGIDTYENAKGKTVWELVAELKSKLAHAEAELADLRQVAQGLNDPAKLHVHILRTLTSKQIHHLLGDEVQAEIATLQEQITKLDAETIQLSKDRYDLQSKVAKLSVAREALEDIKHHADSPFASKDSRTKDGAWLNYCQDVAMKALAQIEGTKKETT